MKHCFFFLVIAALVLGGCSKEQTPEELAGQAAKSYYDRLMADDFEGFMSGKAGMDSVPADYRSQLVSACRQYKHTLDETHGGVASVTISNTRNDSIMQMMQAFLLLNFRDSTKEEIIVPMVLQGDEWKMR